MENFEYNFHIQRNLLSYATKNIYLHLNIFIFNEKFSHLTINFMCSGKFSYSTANFIWSTNSKIWSTDYIKFQINLVCKFEIFLDRK